MKAKRYTTRELVDELPISRRRLDHLRTGRTDRTYRDGEAVYEREEEPILKEGTDYEWERGRVYYTARGRRKLLNRYGGDR